MVRKSRSILEDKYLWKVRHLHVLNGYNNGDFDRASSDLVVLRQL